MIVILYHGKVTADPNEAGKLMSALNREEAQDAWRRRFDFFSKHLKG